jgi:hypothetical protein
MEILAQLLCETVFTPTTFRHTKRLPIRISRPSHKKFHFKKLTIICQKQNSRTNIGSIQIVAHLKTILFDISFIKIG